MTTAAIYGNFKNRDELFIALGQKFWAPVKPGMTVADALAALARATIAAVDDRRSARNRPAFQILGLPKVLRIVW